MAQYLFVFDRQYREIRKLLRAWFPRLHFRFLPDPPTAVDFRLLQLDLAGTVWRRIPGCHRALARNFGGPQRPVWKHGSTTLAVPRPAADFKSLPGEPRNGRSCR